MDLRSLVKSTYEANSVAPLKEASGWIEPYRQFWEESFDRLGEYLKEVQKKKKRRKGKIHAGKAK